MKIFLGGTYGSTWRDDIIPMLKENGIDYFNPVVDDWNDSCYNRELLEREVCDYCLYVITPKMTGVYSIAEAVDDSNKRPKRTMLVVLKYDEEYSFDIGQLKSLKAVSLMVFKNGGTFFPDIKSFVNYLSSIKG